MDYIELTAITESFYKKQLKLKISGFFIKYNKKIYLISIHHNLPIENVMHNDRILDIEKNVSWNELLIINYNNPEYKVHRFMKNNLKNVKELTMNTNNTINNNNINNIIFYNISYEFIEYNNLPNNPRLPYILCDVNVDINFSGLSGMPVMYNDKLVGIFSKYNSRTRKAYIIPIYIAVKSIINNNNVCINNTDSIIKIDYYNVKNNMIYYKPLNYTIPLDSYYLLENNKIESNKICLLKNNTKILYSDTTDIINNDNSLIHIFNKYKITYRLVMLLSKINIDKNIIIFIINNINNKDNKEMYIDEELNINFL